MTQKEQREKINDLCALLTKAIYEPCTCFSKPELECRYCNIMTKADEIMDELPMLQDR